MSPTELGSGPYALLVGEEAPRSSTRCRRAVDHKITIPMPGGWRASTLPWRAGIVIYELSRGQIPGKEYGER